MATMREIKRRRSSIQSTQQITKAMKLVSTVKLQRARTQAENFKAYFQYMYQTVASIFAKPDATNHPYVKEKRQGKIGIVVVTSNRGLAGGYNANVVRMILGGPFEKENILLYTVGKRGEELLSGRGFEVREDYSEVIEAPSYHAASNIGNRLLEDYVSEELREIYIAYTEFENTVSHIPRLRRLLPIEKAEEGVDEAQLVPMNFEPSEKEVIEYLIPKYVAGILYGAFVEAVASENGARMQAMDSATNNAEEIISDLEVKYNRARQGTITQELTEIIAGADAIG